MAGDDEAPPTDPDVKPNTAATAREPRWKLRTAAAPKRAPAAITPAPRSSDRFEVGEELGRGGMGRVVVATDTVLEREVAIKHALVDDEAGLRRFQREAKITAKLEHPSIVPIHDVGVDEEGAPFYIMRRIAGEPLSNGVARAADAKARLAFVPNVLAAVDAAAFAHARGIIHRDIKPWNIVIGSYGETLLIDWGLARAIEDPDADVEDAGRAAGTPGYMAPEQARAQRLDARSDVYALGATLLHVLTGKQLVDSSETAWLSSVARGKPAPLEWIERDVPAELVAIVAKAMAAEPGHRYRDAGEMAADLRAFLAGQLVAAHEYTVWQRIAKLVRRHRVVFATAALALVAVIGIGIFAILSIVRERNEATSARDLANDRAELMLVENASVLAPREPTRAVVLLRQLPVTSRHALRARDITSVAAAYGISHGKQAHAGSIKALEMAPDGHHLLSASEDGTLQVHDLETAASQTLVRGAGEIETAVWTDAGTRIAYATRNGVFTVDVATGRLRTLDASRDVLSLWARADDHRIRFHTGTSRLVIDVATDGTDKRIVVQGARFVYGRGDKLLVTTDKDLRLIDERGERVLATDPQPDARFVKLGISDDGSRAAAGGVVGRAPEITEWDLTTGQEIRRLLNRGPIHIYIGTKLYVSNAERRGDLEVVTNTNIGSLVVEGDWKLVWSASTPYGTALVNADGALAIVGSSVRQFPTHGNGARMIAARPSSPYLAIASTIGMLWWWDLRTMLPRHISIEANGVCHLDRDWIYAIDSMEGILIALPRRGGEPRRIEVRGLCDGHSNGSLLSLTQGDDKHSIVNGTTGEVWHIRTQSVKFVGERVFYVRGRILYELMHGSEVPRWLLPATTLESIATGAHSVTLAFGDGRILWFDVATGLATWHTLPRAPSIVAGDPELSWIATGRELSIFEHGRARSLATFDREIYAISMRLDGALTVKTGDRLLWRVSVTGRVVRLSPGVPKLTDVGGVRTAATVNTFDEVTKIFVDTGERLVIPTKLASAALVDDRSLVVVRVGTPLGLDIYDDPVPPMPVALPSWIDHATNATLMPGSDALTWR